jgi:hypothetical protein
LSAAYSVPDLYSGIFSLARIIQGEEYIGSPWDPAPGDEPPTGVPEKKWIVSLSGSWQAAPFLQVGAGINWSYTANPEHISKNRRSDFEITAFASAKL